MPRAKCQRVNECAKETFTLTSKKEQKRFQQKNSRILFARMIEEANQKHRSP